MIPGHWILPQNDMTLDALERGICLFLLDLVIKYAIRISFDMTSSTAATRLDRYECLLLKRVHYRQVVARDTAQLVMNIKFMSIAPRAAS